MLPGFVRRFDDSAWRDSCSTEMSTSSSFFLPLAIILVVAVCLRPRGLVGSPVASDRKEFLTVSFSVCSMVCLSCPMKKTVNLVSNSFYIPPWMLARLLMRNGGMGDRLDHLRLPVGKIYKQPGLYMSWKTRHGLSGLIMPHETDALLWLSYFIKLHQTSGFALLSSRALIFLSNCEGNLLS